MRIDIYKTEKEGGRWRERGSKLLTIIIKINTQILQSVSASTIISSANNDYNSPHYSFDGALCLPFPVFGNHGQLAHTQ